MVEQTNPAHRLHAVFEQVVRFGERMGANPPSMSQCWVMALDLGISEYLESLVSIVKSVDDIKCLLDITEIRNKDIHVKQLASVKELVFDMGSMDWHDFRSHVTDEFLMLLQVLGNDLSEHSYEARLSVEDLESLQTEIEDLIHDVVESELGDDIKSVIVDGLNAVRNAILEYRVRGAEGMRQAWDRNIGLIARHGQDLQMTSKSDDGHVISKWWAVLQKVDTMISIALNVPQLATPEITQWMLAGAS